MNNEVASDYALCLSTTGKEQSTKGQLVIGTNLRLRRHLIRLTIGTSRGVRLFALQQDVEIFIDLYDVHPGTVRSTGKQSSIRS